MRHAATIALTVACATVVALSVMLTQQAGRVTIAPEQAPEDDPMKLRFLVRDDPDSPTFEVVFTAGPDETLAQLKQRALDAIAAAGLEIVSMV